MAVRISFVTDPVGTSISSGSISINDDDHHHPAQHKPPRIIVIFISVIKGDSGTACIITFS